MRVFVLEVTPMEPPSPQPSVLVVEDDAGVRGLLVATLRDAGLSVRDAADVRQAELALASGIPDLFVVDWMLPGTSGLEYVRELRRRENTRHTPVLMLTARSEEEAKVRGLESGADDYVTKPFSPRELQARVGALLRRSSGADVEGVLRCGALCLDPRSCEVEIDGRPVRLGPTEYRLLRLLLRHHGRVLSRGQILDQIWGVGRAIDERTVDVHVGRLRRALQPHGYHRCLETVRGNGYRMRPPAPTEEAS